MRVHSRTILRGCTAAVAAATLGAVAAGQPITGRPVPELTQFDALMTSFMASNAIEAGLLGVMKDGKIVYLRGFGWQDAGVPMPENAMVRIASVTKPLTAAATRQLIAQGEFSLGTKAFNLGQPGGGLLPHQPFPSLGDQRLKDVTIDHLLRHRGGWDRDEVGDVTYMELAIAADMNVSSPPGRVNTIRWILGQPLQFTPGSATSYSNVGSLTLGLIVEQVTGQGLVQYFRENVLTPEMWIPSTELRLGATFREWGHAREPWYRSLLPAPNVFHNFGPPIVSAPYGGWDNEARVGQGGMVLSVPALLTLADRYHVGVASTLIGRPIDAENPLSSSAAHNGALVGVNTILWQRPDGVRAFVFFNSQSLSGHFGNEFRTLLDAVLNGSVNWPSSTADGFWTTPTATPIGGVGSYDNPYRGFAHSIATTTSGSRIRLKQGSSAWTGTITKRLELTAPLGAVTIGQ